MLSVTMSSCEEVCWHVGSEDRCISMTDTDRNTNFRPYHRCACTLPSYYNYRTYFHKYKSIFSRFEKLNFPMIWSKHIYIIVSLCVLLFFNINLVAAQNLQFSDRTFLDKIIHDYRNSNIFMEDELQKFLLYLRQQDSNKSSDSSASGNDLINFCNRSSDGWKTNRVCLEKQCLNASDILELYEVSPGTNLTNSDLYKLSTALLYQSRKECHGDTVTESPRSKPHPVSSASWSYGFLFVTIINICSLGGVIVLPFMKTAIYKKVLMFMVGMAVGSLAGSGLLFLIPEAFHLVGDDAHEDYIWKATTIFGGIYLFFLIERFLKFLMVWKKQRKLNRAQISKSGSSDSVLANGDYGICSVQVKSPATTTENAKMKGFDGLDPDVYPHGASICYSGDDDSLSMLRENSTMTEASSTPISNHPPNKTQPHCNGVQMNGVEEQEKHKLTKLEHKRLREENEIATVAWMIIFGDGLHNFIDGLSIGASFTESILAGVSVSVAVICEELPHELGDFAILLNSGMPLKKALLFNFLSACMCYLGLMVGILLGQNTSAHDWIFAIAGGMFLYISLVDMLPEMNSAAEEEQKRNGETCSLQVFFIQNAGILTGYSLLLLMAVFGHTINFE